MKMRLVALLVVAVLPLMAFDCITDFKDVTLSLNLSPFNATYPLNDGTHTTYAGSVTIDPTTLYDNSYTLTGASIYDITVSTKGPDLGNCTGTVYITDANVTTALFSYSGAWTTFNTPQSLITSTLLTRNPAGIVALISAVTGKRTVTFSVSGTVGTPPSAQGVDFITMSAYVQAYGHK